MFRAPNHEHKTTAITTPAIIIIIICRHNTKFLTHKSAFGARFLSLAFFHISVENERWAASSAPNDYFTYIHEYFGAQSINKPKPIATNERRKIKRKKEELVRMSRDPANSNKKERERAFLLLQSNARQWVAVQSIIYNENGPSQIQKMRRTTQSWAGERVFMCVCVCVSQHVTKSAKASDPIVWTGWTRDGMEAIHSKYIQIFFFYFSNKIWIQNLNFVFGRVYFLFRWAWNCRKAIYV